jgi:hypothetical protein
LAAHDELPSVGEHPDSQANQDNATSAATEYGVSRIDHFLDCEGRKAENEKIVEHEERYVERDVAII